MGKRLIRSPRNDAHNPYDMDGYAAVRGNDLIFSGDVDDRMFSFLWDGLLKSGIKLDGPAAKGKENRRLFLNSLGGSCYTANSIVDLFEEVDDLTTIATGACMSAAVPIIAAGTPGQRFATHRTRFMLHPAYDTPDGRFERTDYQANEEEIAAVELIYSQVMARYCAGTLKWWQEKLSTHKPWYFSAEEAKKLGIIDEVMKDQLKGRQLKKRRK